MNRRVPADTNQHSANRRLSPADCLSARQCSSHTGGFFFGQGDRATHAPAPTPAGCFRAISIADNFPPKYLGSTQYLGIWPSGRSRQRSDHRDYCHHAKLATDGLITVSECGTRLVFTERGKQRFGMITWIALRRPDLFRASLRGGLN
jgi:hypothetical protein